MGFFRKRRKGNNSFKSEYEYCKIFVELSEAIKHSGEKNSKVVIIYDNETRSLKFTVKGEKSIIRREFENQSVYVFKRLHTEVGTFKECKVEKCIYL